MPQRERIGIHHDDAVGTVAAEVGAVVFQSPAVFHQDGLGCRGQEAESQAFENGLVLRLGEDLDIRETSFGGNGDQPGDQGDGESEGAGGPGDSDAFDDVAGKSAAGQDFAVGGEDRHI